MTPRRAPMQGRVRLGLRPFVTAALALLGATSLPSCVVLPQRPESDAVPAPIDFDVALSSQVDRLLAPGAQTVVAFGAAPAFAEPGQTSERTTREPDLVQPSLFSWPLDDGGAVVVLGTPELVFARVAPDGRLVAAATLPGGGDGDPSRTVQVAAARDGVVAIGPSASFFASPTRIVAVDLPRESPGTLGRASAAERVVLAKGQPCPTPSVIVTPVSVAEDGSIAGGNAFGRLLPPCGEQRGSYDVAFVEETAPGAADFVVLDSLSGAWTYGSTAGGPLVRTTAIPAPPGGETRAVGLPPPNAFRRTAAGTLLASFGDVMLEWNVKGDGSVRPIDVPAPPPSFSAWKTCGFGAAIAERWEPNPDSRTSPPLRTPSEYAARSLEAPGAIVRRPPTPCVVESECRRLGESYLLGDVRVRDATLSMYALWAWQGPIAVYAIAAR